MNRFRPITITYRAQCGHVYAFRFTAWQRGEVLRTIERMASNPRCPFTWVDAESVGQVIKGEKVA
jgi:hypothetical protein